MDGYDEKWDKTGVFLTRCNLISDPWQDLKDNYGKGGYEHLTSLKKNHPHLKVTLAIGGWNEVCE